MSDDPQRIAFAWHLGDVVLAGAVLAFALVGLVGHLKLRKSYARWHECQPRVVA